MDRVTSSASGASLGVLASGASSRRRGRRVSSWLPFLAPAVIVLLLVGVVPLVTALQMSFTSFSYVLPGRTGQWIGTENYTSLLSNGAFLGAIGRTIAFTVSAVVLELAIGLLLATGLNATGRGRGPLLSLLIIPMILTPVIVGLMFNFALNPQFGPIASIIRGGTGSSVDILGSPMGAFAALVLADVWQWSSFMALMLWAGMQALPPRRSRRPRSTGPRRCSAFA